MKAPLFRQYALGYRLSGWIMAGAVMFLWSLAAGPAAARQVLPGHVPAAAKRLQPLRGLEATNVLQLAIGLPLRNQGGLTNLLADIYNPASPNYRHFLTPDEFAGRFGPAEQDYQAVMAFARTNGLKIVGTHPNRVLLDVAGAAPDIERAFHLRLRVYRHPTEAREFYAPDAEPQLDLAAPVLHVSGLDNFQIPQPLCRELPPASSAATPAGVKPASGSGPSGNYAGRDFHAAYAPGVTNNGAGQAVGLLEFQGYYASDITSYEAAYALPNVTLNNVLLGGLSSITADAGDPECPLDIEMAISMATNLSQVIIYCTTRSGNTDTVLNRMATDNLCKQMSASWIIGADATGLQIYEQMAAQGQTFFSASGDSDAGTAAAPVGNDVPYTTTVGGTTLSTSGAGGSRTSETTWNWGGGTGSTGGISPTYPIPLWQQGVNMDTNQGSRFMRNVPDVACVANGIWVLYNNGGSGSFGGTSCAAPLWAGFLALVNQQAAAKGLSSVGFINNFLYAIGKSARYAQDFNDITTGNNTSSTSPNEYFAVPGYDLCTGLGTPAGQNLINDLVQGLGDPLNVTPTNGLAAAGPVGGPFAPASGTFTLANFAGTTNRWSLVNTSTWCTVSPASGSLLPGASANVTVTIASAASSLPAGLYATSLLFSNLTTTVAQNRQVTLTVGTGLIWDSSASGGAPQDGPGTWADQSSTNGNTNWWNGATDVLWANASPEIATFGAGSGAADVVTLGGAVTAAGINFITPGSGSYTIAGGGYTLTLDGDVSANAPATISAPVALGLSANFSAASGQTLTVSGLIAGPASNSLAITGPGVVSLSGPNNTGTSAGMAGGVAVNSGTLALNSSSTYGTLGNVSGITVASGATLSLQGVNAISGSSGTPRNVTVNGGSLTNAGGGNHALGLLTLNGGTVSGAGSGSAGSFNLKGDCLVNSNSALSALNVTAAAGTSFNVNNGATLNFSGTLIGSGGLNYAGPGTMVLSGTNTYSGPTTNLGGTLELGNGGVGGSLGSGAVANGGVLEVNRADNFTWNNPVSDPNLTGSLVKLNTNTLTLGANGAFLGGGPSVMVNGGTLQIPSPYMLTAGGGFWIAENAATGACIINGGALVVSNWLAVGRNSSAALGALTLNSGLIQETGNGGNIIMGSLSGAGALTVNGGALSNNAAIWLGEDANGKGTLNLNGGLVQAAQITRSPNGAGASAIVNFNGGTLQAISNQAAFLAVDQAVVQAGNAIIDDGGNTIAIGQALLNGGGGGGLVKLGNGTVALNAGNTYAGPTTVNAGTLQLRDPVLHFSFDNVSGGTVVNDGAGGAALNGTIVGANLSIVPGGRFGSALKIGAGAVNAGYVVVSNAVVPLNGSGTWTAAMWIKTTVAGGTYLYQGDGNWVGGDTTLYLNSGGGGGTKGGGVRWGAGWEEGFTVLNNGNWHFIALVDNGGAKTFYVDGRADTLAVNSWGSAAGVGGQLWIGGSADTSDGDVTMTNGLIDEVYIYSRALSSAEISSLMSSNSLGSRQILPAGTAVTLGTAATLDLGGMSQNIGSLAGASGSAVLLGLGTNASALTFGNASNTTFAGTISGSGAVIKNGAGAVTLSGVNTYSKATVINAGTVGFGAGNNSNAVASLQPLLWLSFDQVGGSVITNRGTGGSALNGTLVGANVSIVPGGRNGNALKAGSGSYSSSYVLVNNPGTLFNGATPGSSWTVALWVKTSASGGAFLYQGSGSWSSGNTSFFLTSATQASSGSTYAGGRVGGVRYGGGWMGGNINVNDNNWHFLTITDNGGAKTIYVDGNADTNYTASQLWNTAAAGTELWIGGTADTGDGNAAFNGLIDEFFVFNRALNQNEILNLMAPVTNTAGQLPAATPVSLAAAATLDLSGISQTIASLSDIGGGGGLVTNSAGAGAVLVLSNNLAGAATFSGQINDAGVNPVSLVKSGSYTQVLAGASGCSGPAVVSGGSLMVNGALGAGSVSVAGGTLGGTGILSGPVTVQSGGTLSPGYAGIGTLTISNSLTLGGTNLMEINKSLQTNDLVAASGAVTFGGTLTVTNLAGTLAAGDSFMLFQAAACNSSFAVWNLPALGTGLAWNTNSLTNGVLAVIATLAPQFGSILQTGDGNYQFTGAGSAGVTYELDAATNLAPPIAWSFVTNTVADQSGQFELLDLSATNFPQRFYRITSSQ